MKLSRREPVVFFGALAVACSGSVTTLEHELGPDNGGETVAGGGGESVPPPGTGATGAGGYGTGAVGAGGYGMGAVGAGGYGMGAVGTGGHRTGAGGGPFVAGGLIESGEWSGYAFTVAGAGSTISPSEFTGGELCASGTLGPAYEEWAAIGWNIAQPIDPVTYEGGTPAAIAPGGVGVQLSVLNHGPAGLRVVLNTDVRAGESWCAALPAGGSGILSWSDFRKECWSPGGDVYDGVTPIAQILISAFASSDAAETNFDFCWDSAVEVYD